jgi:histidinol-phosphate aminotransferase
MTGDMNNEAQRGTLARRGLIRDAVRDLAPYTPLPSIDRLAEGVGLPVERILKLDQNENPYGPSLRVQEALASYDRFGLYPDSEGRAARARLAAYVGMPAERLLLGNGADELIDLLYLLTLDAGDEVIVAPPTFGVYAARASLFGGRVVNVPRRADFGLDMEALAAAVTPRTKLIVIVSPNNPTGNTIDQEQLVRLLGLGPLVVLDEAYIEFAQRSFVPLAREFDNLVVLRTLSKWAGLAGLRLGYGIFPTELMPYLWQIKPPFNVNAAALLATEATFDDFHWVRSSVARLRIERGRLYRNLRKLNLLQPYPSQGNFILCRVIHGEAARLRGRLAELGIMVRGYEGELAGFLRISVGRPEDTDTLMKALLSIAGRF